MSIYAAKSPQELYKIYDKIFEHGFDPPKLIAQPDDLCYSYLDFCIDHPRYKEI